MAVRIDTSKCVGCGLCIEICPAGATYNVKGKTYINQDRCTLCGKCERMCIVSALTFEITSNAVVRKDKKGINTG